MTPQAAPQPIPGVLNEQSTCFITTAERGFIRQFSKPGVAINYMRQPRFSDGTVLLLWRMGRHGSDSAYAWKPIRYQYGRMLDSRTTAGGFEL